MIVVWKDGTYRECTEREANGFEQDPNWLVTIPLPGVAADADVERLVNTEHRCAWCGEIGHTHLCPRIRALEFDKMGKITRYEFFEEKTEQGRADA